MDRDPNRASEAERRVETVAEPLASLALDGAAAPTRRGPLAAAAHPTPEEPQRDIVAAVLYYGGERALFGADAEPPLLGKYPVERILGSGGKGAVLLGRNPDLNEEVAIKVLRHDNARDRESEGVRLLREGQVLARLDHPNIVPILDAGVAGDDRYIVMRRVRGTTLREAQRGAGWRAIVDLYVQAGRGLAVVHAAGLIHRDFKPDNVLVDEEGRVMLADFGLVCLAGDRGTSGAAPRGRAREAFAARLTLTDEFHGTPAYMAPEASDGGPPAATLDIFAFGVSLFEALYGELPFPGSTWPALLHAIVEGRIRARPADTAVPTWLDRLARRMLAADPARRPALDEVLTALDFRARTSRRRRILGTATVAVVGVSLGALTLSPPDPCAEPATKLAGVWDDAASERLSRLGDDGARLAARLDHHADDWLATFVTVCRATYTHGTQSSELHDARMRCLDQRRRELAAAVGPLAGSPDQAALDGALLAAAGLDSARACASADGMPRPRADQEPEAAALAGALAEVRVRELAGDYQESRAHAAGLAERARALGYEPLLAESLFALGRASWLVRDGAAARTALTEALDLAELHRLDALAADSANLLAKLAALVLREPALGHEWARQAERKLARIGGDRRRRAELLNNRGLIAYELDADFPAARRLHEQALALRQQLQADGEEARMAIAESRLNLGNVLGALGDLSGGIASYQESRRIQAEVLGPDHPQIAEVLFAVAADQMSRGESAVAFTLGTEALRIYQRRPGDAVALARAHYLLSSVQSQRGRLDDALRHARQALTAVRPRRAEHPDEVAMMHDRLASALRDAGDHGAALSEFDEGLALLAAARSPAPELRVQLLFNRADLLVDMRRFAAARDEYAAVDDLIRAGGPARTPLRPYLLKGLGRMYLHERRPLAAIPLLEEALGSLASEGDAALRAELQLLLAQALPESELPRAQRLARAAAEYYESIDDGELAAEARRYISDHATGRAPATRERDR